MKPVFQEIIDQGVGDCFSACLASLLELPISEVPKFRRDHGDKMMHAAQHWAKEYANIGIVTIQMENMDDDFTGADIRLIGGTDRAPCIAGGVSPNLPGCLHAVVGEIDEHGMNFRMTHDPNPSGKGIIGRPTHLYFLIPLNLAVKKPQL